MSRDAVAHHQHKTQSYYRRGPRDPIIYHEQTKHSTTSLFIASFVIASPV